MRIQKYLFLFLFGLWSCKGDDDVLGNQVPILPTDLTINLNQPLYNPLTTPGGWAYVLGGSQGIVVYRLSETEFSAFDRHCTYQVSDNCQIMMEDPTTAHDETCCGSRFEVIFGTPVNGPATFPLRAYNTQYNPNANLLRIFN